MTKMPILETERLHIRPFVMDDLDAIHEAFVDAGWVDSNLSETQALEQRKTWLQWASINPEALANLYQPPYGDRAVILKDSGELVGSVGIVPELKPFGLLPYYQACMSIRDPQQSFPEVGLFWITRKAHQGKGYASEAGSALIAHMFTNFNLTRIIASTDHDNLASQGVMRKLGMILDKNPNDEPVWMQVVGILENDRQQ